MVYAEKYVGFWLSYLLPNILFVFCPLLMVGLSKYYVKKPPQGDVIVKAMNLWGFAMRGRWSLNLVRTWINLSSPNLWDGAFWFTHAFSSAISQAFVPLATDHLFVWLYATIAILTLFEWIAFWRTFRSLDKLTKGDYLSNSKGVGSEDRVCGEGVSLYYRGLLVFETKHGNVRRGIAS